MLVVLQRKLYFNLIPTGSYMILIEKINDEIIALYILGIGNGRDKFFKEFLSSVLFYNYTYCMYYRRIVIIAKY